MRINREQNIYSNICTCEDLLERSSDTEYFEIQMGKKGKEEGSHYNQQSNPTRID